MAEPAPHSRPPARRGPLLVVFFTVLLDLLGFGMVLPLLPFYAQEFGSGPVGVTLLFASFSLAQFVFAPLWGRLSDRVGRRPVLLVSITGAVAAYGLFAFARSFTVLLIARTASGIAAANYSIGQAYVADVTPPEERAKGMGMLGAAFGLGFVLGPVLGGLAGKLGYAAVPAAAGVLALINLGLALFMLPESLPAEKRKSIDSGRWAGADDVRRAAGNRPVAWLMVLFFLVILAFASMESTIGLFVEKRYGFGFFETAMLFTFLGVVMVVIQGGLLGRLAKRFGERRLIVSGIACMTAGLFLLPVGKLLALLGLTTALLALGMGLHNPSTLSLISRLTDEHRQGGTLGVTRSLGALARGVGPLWGGWAFGALGPAWPFWIAAGLMACALVLAIGVIRTIS
jgi:multidrug resistance protein